ncbi:hypothetical protein F4777DRAFT_167784 [Nemania sp. FL0916]|nr:hypothetical protein F4777DRAFT_167784 [Nemania sp. FL0916]
MASHLNTCKLVACAAWLLMHRILVNQGFVLRRRGLSTDAAAALAIGLTTTAWTVSALHHVYSLEAPDGLEYMPWGEGNVHISRLLLAAVEAPLLTQGIFILWFAKWLSASFRIRIGKAPQFSQSIHFGPFGREDGIQGPLSWVLAAVISIIVGVVSGLVVTLDGPPPAIVTRAVLNIAGLVLFLFGGAPKHPYNDAPHKYSDDVLRIILPTSHHEGTVYQLPSAKGGLDAIWSPKIANEHLEADNEIMVLFQHMRSGRWMPSEPLERLRKTMAKFMQRVALSPEQARLLAAWIYVDKSRLDDKARSIQCQRPPGVHLIGRDLMYALCHAEYLVFMSQGVLDKETRSKLGQLRLVSRTGANVEGGQDHTVGYLPGLEGYREAVKYIYSIFDMPVEEEALNFSHPPPSFSIALGKSPESIDEYVSELWELSKQHCESTFSALYFFTTVWYMELGNVYGFHIFPLRCHTTDGDLVTQEMTWRQIWYSACFSQLVAVSPILFGAFAAGIFP